VCAFNTILVQMVNGGMPLTLESVRMNLINPLTSELNPSAQRCMTRFSTKDFAS
jgi:hypothetical protein